MNRKALVRSLTAAVLVVWTLTGCESEESRPAPATRKVSATQRALPVEPPPVQGNGLNAALKPEPNDFAPPEYKDEAPAAAAGARMVKVARNIYMEVQGDRRRVLINAYVCLREGQLEQLLCRKETKEHESILVADIDAREAHAALLLAGARQGKAVQYEPMYKPASGQPIKVSLIYEQKGQPVTVPAQQWIRNMKTKKDLQHDWVFAGSRLIENPDDPKKVPIYLANDGDVICVSNFESAMLDLPVVSPKDNADLAFEPHTERIPPKRTKVIVALEPMPEKKD